MNDPAALAARFDAALGARGIEAGTRRAAAFAAALLALEARTADDVYWIARTSMLPSIDVLDAFHAAFFDFWNGLVDLETLRELVQKVPGALPHSGVRPEGTARPPAPALERAAPQDERDAPMFLAMAAPDERLGHRDFAEMDDAERARALRAILLVRAAVEMRRSRRRRGSARGDRLDMRASLREAARTAGDIVRARRSARRERPRPLVFLCDVSGSMGPYARAMLQYARVAAIARPRVRAFAFATELTDLGPALVRGSLAQTMLRFSALLRDYGGGTRIGTSLRAFNDRYAQRGVARGGTVVLLSDGWERDDPALLGREMGRLRKLCRRIVWVNPQKKHPAFEPLARGMAAALPHVDALVAGHNLRSLERVAQAIAGGIA